MEHVIWAVVAIVMGLLGTQLGAFWDKPHVYKDGQEDGFRDGWFKGLQAHNIQPNVAPSGMPIKRHPGYSTYSDGQGGMTLRYDKPRWVGPPT